MKMYRSFAIVLCMALLVPFLHVSLTEADVTIAVMHKNNELFPEQIEQFEAENPGIKVEMIESDMNTLLSRIAAGSPPNIVRVHSFEIPFFAVRGLLVPVDEYMAQSELINEDDLESVVDSHRYDVDKKVQGEGALYGFPKDYSLLFDFFYRKDVFDEAGVPHPSMTEPLSYDEFFKLCEKLVVREGDRTIRWAYDGMFSGEPEVGMEMLLAQKGMSLYKDDMKTLDLQGNPEAIKMIRYIYDMAKAHIISSPMDPSEVWLGGNLADENPRTGIYQLGYWAGAMYTKPEVIDKFGYAPGPIWDGGKWLNGGWVTGMVMFDSGDKALNDAAWKFMEFYNAGQPAIDRAKSGWGLPMLKSMRAMVPQETQFDKERLEVTVKQLDDGYYYASQGNPWALTPLKNVWNKYWGEVLADNMSFDDFVATLEREINDLLLDGVYSVGE